MYVCVCHAFTDHDVRATGASTVGEAYRNLGVRPSCGKCVPFVQDVLHTSKRMARSRSTRE
jgi:bacterioferritin-associated ferredoxin